MKANVEGFGRPPCLSSPLPPPLRRLPNAARLLHSPLRTRTGLVVGSMATTSLPCIGIWRSLFHRSLFRGMMKGVFASTYSVPELTKITGARTLVRREAIHHDLGGLCIANRRADLRELFYRVANLLVENATVGDDNDGVEHGGIVFAEADELMCEPGEPRCRRQGVSERDAELRQAERQN